MATATLFFSLSRSLAPSLIHKDDDDDDVAGAVAGAGAIAVEFVPDHG
jgi:hypothetical protein